MSYDRQVLNSSNHFTKTLFQKLRQGEQSVSNQQTYTRIMYEREMMRLICFVMYECIYEVGSQVLNQSSYQLGFEQSQYRTTGHAAYTYNACIYICIMYICIYSDPQELELAATCKLFCLSIISSLFILAFFVHHFSTYIYTYKQLSINIYW